MAAAAVCGTDGPMSWLVALWWHPVTARSGRDLVADRRLRFRVGFHRSDRVCADRGRESSGAGAGCRAAADTTRSASPQSSRRAWPTWHRLQLRPRESLKSASNRYSRPRSPSRPRSLTRGSAGRTPALMRHGGRGHSAESCLWREHYSAHSAYVEDKTTTRWWLVAWGRSIVMGKAGRVMLSGY